MSITDLTPGLKDPVTDSQAVFRAVLDAMSRPAQPVTVPALPAAPEPLSRAAGAVALALTDLDTPVWLDASLGAEAVRNWLSFHAGCPLIQRPADAAFCLLGDAGGLTDLDGFALGTPEYPDRSATLIVQADRLIQGHGDRFTGPGIKTATRLMIEGLPPAFWDAWAANGALFPQGVDVLFATDTQICGLPRTTIREG